MKKISSYIPVTQWTRIIQQGLSKARCNSRYNCWSFHNPEAIAFVSLAGLPPEVGLYSAMVGLLVYMIPWFIPPVIHRANFHSFHIGRFYTGFFVNCQCRTVCYDSFIGSYCCWCPGNSIMVF